MTYRPDPDILYRAKGNITPSTYVSGGWPTAWGIEKWRISTKQLLAERWWDSSSGAPLIDAHSSDGPYAGAVGPDGYLYTSWFHYGVIKHDRNTLEAIERVWGWNTPPSGGTQGVVALLPEPRGIWIASVGSPFFMWASAVPMRLLDVYAEPDPYTDPALIAQGGGGNLPTIATSANTFIYSSLDADHSGRYFYTNWFSEVWRYDWNSNTEVFIWGVFNGSAAPSIKLRKRNIDGWGKHMMLNDTCPRGWSPTFLSIWVYLIDEDSGDIERQWRFPDKVQLTASGSPMFTIDSMAVDVSEKHAYVFHSEQGAIFKTDLDSASQTFAAGDAWLTGLSVGTNSVLSGALWTERSFGLVIPPPRTDMKGHDRGRRIVF